MKEYKLYFAKICEGLIFRFDQDLENFDKVKVEIESRSPYKSVKELDLEVNSGIADILNILYRRILEQPFWYYESVKTDKPVLENNIELAIDRFNRSVYNANIQFNLWVRKNNAVVTKIFDELLFVSNNILMQIDSFSFDVIGCDYKKTPLFFRLMEFILIIQKRAGNAVPFYPEIENYFNTIHKYQNQFISSILPEKQIKNIDSKLLNNQAMTQISDETARYYSFIYGKLKDAKDPARMLNELKDNGFKCISEDFQRIIDDDITTYRKDISGLLLANPNSKPETLGIPGFKNEIKKAEFIRSLFDKQSNNTLKNPVLSDVLNTWLNDKFLNKFVLFIEIIDILYYRKVISDLMIDEFLYAFPLLKSSIYDNNEELTHSLSSSIQPTMDKIMDYLRSDFLTYKVNDNIDTGIGLEKQTIEGWEIPITPEKIIRYINETNSPFLTSSHINDAKFNFMEQQKADAKKHSKTEIHNQVENKYQMDYLEIVIAGYENKNTRQFLPEYFYREFKKAEKENYGAREFFNGCLSVIDYFEETIKLQFSQRESELLILKGAAEHKTIKIFDYVNPKPYEQQCIDTIKYCEIELSKNKIEFYNMPLDDISKNKHSENLPYNHVLFIKKAINEAKQKVLDSQKQETVSSIESVKIKKQVDPSIVLNNFDKFINEITTLELKISASENIYYLDDYSQFVRIYYPMNDESTDYELVLQYDSNVYVEHALSDFLNLNLTDEQIKKHILRIQNVENSLNEFYLYFLDFKEAYSPDEKFDPVFFMLHLSKPFLLIFPDGKIQSEISENFISNLGHAVNYKLQLIYVFLGRLNKLVKIDLNSNSEVSGLNSIYSESQLLKIFSQLQTRKIVNASDKDAFLNIFNNKFSGQVHWNDSIYKAKAGLFDLIQRITGESISASTLKKYFITSSNKIHDNSKLKKETTLIDEILSGI